MAEPLAAADLEQANREEYNHIVDNPFVRAIGKDALSTFAIDVDTASYANMRRFINGGELSPPDAVRIEELVNYFNYDYPSPTASDAHPFAVNIAAMPAPWKPEHKLVRIGLKGRDIEQDVRPATNLVFLIDVSGSMQSTDKLPLLKQSFKLLVDQLHGDDRVAIVVYAGAAGIVLPSTYCSQRNDIMAAIDRLQAGGSTNGGAGLRLAYDIAKQNYIKGGVNRVILATDGDFNVGVSSEADLVRLIEQRRDSGVYLSVLGFGTGNYQDAKMEQLSNKGNGNAAYIDSLREARKALVEQISGTLVTIARDVKIQVEFNPAQVQAYRLIGYENRMLAAQDFNDDNKDAGEIGAGHTVTALYEVVPHDVAMTIPGVDALKYHHQEPAVHETADASPELLTVKLRYKSPEVMEGSLSTLIEIPFIDTDASIEHAPMSLRFASAVAGAGMILRNSPYRGNATLDVLVKLAEQSRGEDAGGYRAEFISMMRQVSELLPVELTLAGAAGQNDL